MVADGPDRTGPAGIDEIERLGGDPVVTRVTVGDATLEIAAAAMSRRSCSGPSRRSVDATVDVVCTATAASSEAP